jgi:hypothetical protein
MRVNDVTERIRAAVEKNPRRMTLQLGRDLGVPEVEVIRAFPADRVMELDIARWQELLENFQAFGSVRVLVSNGATTIEVDGQFGGFSTAGEFFNVQTVSSTCTSAGSSWPLCSPWKSLDTWMAPPHAAFSSSIRQVPPLSKSSSTSAGRSHRSEKQDSSS